MHPIFEELYEAIKHGDESHQEWLKNEMEDFYDRVALRHEVTKKWYTRFDEAVKCNATEGPPPNVDETVWEASLAALRFQRDELKKQLDKYIIC